VSPRRPLVEGGPSGYGRLPADALDRLHTAGLELLERVGVDVHDESALEVLAGEGARVDGTRARIPPGLVERAVATAPGSFVLRGRAGDGSLDVTVRPGGGLFGNGTDTLYFRDIGSGERRRAVLADVATIAAACESLPEVDFVMAGVLPADVPLERIDLAQFGAMLGATRKPLVIAPATAGETLSCMVQMAALAGGAASFAVLGMSTPPLQLDASCLGKARACGRAGVPFICAPSDSLGTTAPASPAGAVAVGHAEVLAVLVVHQLWSPGSPFVYGVGSGSAFDMRDLVDVWTSPEGLLADAASCQLGHALGLPTWSYAGGCDARCVDGQLAAELAVSTIVASQTGAALYHDLGEFEAGVQNSIESLVLGNEVASLARRLLAGIRVDEETLQLDDIEAVGPGGSFLGRPYTRAHHRDAWRSTLFETSARRRWAADGAKGFETRLHEAALELLERRAPVLDEETAAAIDALVARRGGIPYETDGIVS
jgi:trimethylamine--corrinoid protein Co-methyltransferase